MKKVIRTVALIAVLGMMAPACQKEPVSEPLAQVGSVKTIHTVYYSVDGVTNTASFNSEENWLFFLGQLFALAEVGYEVSFWDSETVVNTTDDREIVTYTTRDKDEAVAWADTMRKNGYTVSISYDSVTNTYTCTAVK